MSGPSFSAGFTAVLLPDSKPLESAEASTFFMQSCLRALSPTGVDPNSSAPDADLHLGVHSPESPFCSSPGGLSHRVVCSSTICFVLTTVSHSLTHSVRSREVQAHFCSVVRPALDLRITGRAQRGDTGGSGLVCMRPVSLSTRLPSTLPPVSQGCPIHEACWGRGGL